jgi:hypothetical protein
VRTVWKQRAPPPTTKKEQVFCEANGTVARSFPLAPKKKRKKNSKKLLSVSPIPPKALLTVPSAESIVKEYRYDTVEQRQIVIL